MNMIICGENCRYQKDGYCMLDDLTHANASASSECCYFEKALIP